MGNDKISGRGSELDLKNRFLQLEYSQEHLEGLDEIDEERSRTEFLVETAKRVVNPVNSPDLPFEYSLNPYQGCEHGCSYCYARPTHEYWGYSAGLDFEQKILVKKNVLERLKNELSKSSWKVSPIILSGNTDCYQPAEKKFELTRSILDFLLKHKHPLGIISKNALILRDLDILKALAEENLVRVNISITSLDKSLRRRMEPRTSSPQNRLRTVEILAKNNIPVNVMAAPIIPGLNSDEIPAIAKAAASAGANDINYTLVRLNGSVEPVFKDWLWNNYPTKYKKVISLIQQCRQGQLQGTDFKTRMKGEGEIANSIKQLYRWSRNKYFSSTTSKQDLPPLACNKFIPPNKAQYRLLL